jgi:hypothetical protein
MKFFEIQSGVEMPASRFGPSFSKAELPDISHLAGMQVGDSVLCETRAERKRVFVFLKKHGMACETRRSGAHYRVWRTA